MKKIKASAFLSSILVLFTCLLFLQMYQQLFRDGMINNQLLIEYLQNN